MDILIKGVDSQTTDKTILISGEGMVPTSDGKEYPTYIVTGLAGEMKEGTIIFSMMCAANSATEFEVRRYGDEP